MAKAHPTVSEPLPEGAVLVPGYPDYCATPAGVLYGRRYHPRRNVHCRWRVMKSSPAGAGYVAVNLYNDDGIWHVHVHIIVMLVFAGPCPAGLEVRHTDGVKANNRRSNLCYGTPIENGADTRRLLLARHGEQHYNAKVTAAIVREIRRRDVAGVETRHIASALSLRRAHVRKIITKKLWAHVT